MFRKLIVKSKADGTYEGVAFEGGPSKIKNYEYFAVLTPEELRGKRIYLILKTARFFFETCTMQLPVITPEIIRLKLIDRVNTLAYFGKEVNIYWRVLEDRGAQVTLSYLALERDFVEKEILRLKAISGVRLEAVTFLPLSLSNAIPRDPTEKMVIHRERDGLWILVMTQNNVHFIEYLPIDELLGINPTELREKIAFIQNLVYRNTQQKIGVVLVTDPALVEMVVAENVEVRGIELAYPEYFGILSLQEEYNFLPPEERALKRVLETNEKISYVLVLFGLLIAISALAMFNINRKIEQEIKRKEIEINESLQRLFSQYPEGKLRAYRLYLEEKSKLEKYPQLRDIFLNVIKTLEETRIIDFSIKKEGDKYQVSIKFERTLPFVEIQSFTQKITLGLSSVMEIQESRVEYIGSENKLLFDIKGILKSRQ